MSAKKHVSRISAESRRQEGIFLGIFGGGVGASDYAIGTPDEVQPARAPEVPPEHVLPPPVGEPAGPDRDEST